MDADMLREWGSRRFVRLEKFIDGEWYFWPENPRDNWQRKPEWWFRGLDELGSIKEKPRKIEYLKIGTGETFIHMGGTAYWEEEKGICKTCLYDAGITHWRILDERRL